MTYGETKQFLDRHTRVVELTDGQGARVAICPEFVGRVMTSTCDGADGSSFGFVNRAFIEAGNLDPKFNNYGGEERMWLSPEGGQFSLWFEQGEEQTWDNWVTPAALNHGAWQVESAGDRHCRMTTAAKFQNASSTPFELDIARDVRLVDAAGFRELFGPAAADCLGGSSGDGVTMVGYETTNQITNLGPDMTAETGLLSIWILGQMMSSPRTVVVVPYRPGSEDSLGPVVKADYFGQVPPDRLKVLREAVLFRADSCYRSKIGTSQRRAQDVLGSIDFANGVLTIVKFTMPDDPAQDRYVNNMWESPLAEPYIGDVINSYNDGPASPDEAGFGEFYEIESLSPAKVLGSGQSLEHRHRTFHLRADEPTLAALAKEIFGVEWQAVRDAMFGDKG